jgi:hypothetical protein
MLQSKESFAAKSEVLMAVITKITVFWDKMPCSVVDIYQHLRGTFRLHLQGRKVDHVGKRSQ